MNMKIAMLKKKHGSISQLTLNYQKKTQNLVDIIWTDLKKKTSFIWSFAISN